MGWFVTFNAHGEAIVVPVLSTFAPPPIVRTPTFVVPAEWLK